MKYYISFNRLDNKWYSSKNIKCKFMAAKNKKLAINGHPTRGNEVIELLKMMGGSDSGVSGSIPQHYYYLDTPTHIDVFAFESDFFIRNKDNFVFYTLEEFLEKYPFKINDRVIDKADRCPGVISEMKWDEGLSDMKYFVAFGNGIDFGWFANDSIEFYKEITPLFKPGDDMGTKVEYPGRNREDVLFDSIIWHLRNSVNNGKQNLSCGECEDYFREVVKENNENKMKNVIAELLEHIKNTSKEELEKEFNELEEWSNVGPTVEEFMDFCNKVNKKPKYPKTYAECKEMLEKDMYYGFTNFMTLQKLIICRDVYWKIAGEQMGLGKPWDSVYGCGEWGYWIGYDINANNIYCQDSRILLNHLLVFPTAEMRDAFYDNFKDLIEQCKNFL